MLCFPDRCRGYDRVSVMDGFQNRLEGGFPSDASGGLFGYGDDFGRALFAQTIS
jgi:hypothetical protein